MPRRHFAAALLPLALAALAVASLTSPLALAQSPAATSASGAPSPATSAPPAALVTVAVDYWPQSFDPALRQPGPPTVIVALHEPLVRLKPDSSELDTGLSLASKVAVTGDGLLWEVSLKTNQMFSDGTPLDAEAVAFTLGRLLRGDHPARPANPAIPDSVRNLVKNILVRDKTTLVIELTSPYSPLIGIFASPHAGIISPASFKGGKLANPPVGCGPFTLAKEGPGRRLELVPNIRLNRQRPGIPRIDVVPAPPGPARLLWLLAGRGDLVEGLTRRDSEDLASYPKYKLNRAPGLGSVTLYLNPAVVPFQAPLLREALIRGIPEELMAQFLFDGRCQPFRAFYPPWTWGAGKAFKAYGYDSVEAKRLLTMANVDRNGTAFVMWVVPADGTTKESMAPFLEALRGTLRELNVSCLTEVVGRAELPQRLAAGGAQAVMYWHDAVIADPDEVTTAALGKDRPLSRFANVSGDEFNSLATQARGREDRTSREFLYGELEKIVVPSLSVISLACPLRLTAHSERLQGFRFGSDGSTSLEDLRVAP
jgi:peptide/nickel transport system substrate-binding protein